jgi:uncharacterized phage-associated protein
MIITRHREKLINAIIYFAKQTKHCGKTKLLKLLYFLDFYHFKQTAKSVTGLEYFAWEQGPVPKELFEELSGNMKADLKDAISLASTEDFQKIVPKKKFNEDYFTNREKKLLKDLSDVFKDAKVEEMVEVSHLRNEPWDKTLKEKGPRQKIDYMLSIDDEENSLSYNEAKERMEEITEMHQIFGTG